MSQTSERRNQIIKPAQKTSLDVPQDNQLDQEEGKEEEEEEEQNLLDAPQDGYQQEQEIEFEKQKQKPKDKQKKKHSSQQYQNQSSEEEESEQEPPVLDNPKANNQPYIMSQMEVEKYKQKKQVKRKPEFHELDSELESEAIQNAQKALKVLANHKKREEEKIKYLKLQQPKRFCSFHKVLYNTEQDYIAHTIKHHKLTAVEENLVSFCCSRCGSIYQVYGHYKNHIASCKGIDEYLDSRSKLTPQMKHLAKLGQEIGKQKK
ncbi:hypothetical protein ABPG72_017753 [Tetrahymena utriculariae]